MDAFLIHACEQILRFTRAERWNDLSEERKVQLGFNAGVVALGLKLTKEEGFDALTRAREERISMTVLNEHFKRLIEARQVPVDEGHIARPF